MHDGLPRALIDELITRWDLARLKLLVVEGPFDKRLVNLIQAEPHCVGPLRGLDVWPVDSIDVPAELLRRHGFEGTGAKQRVVAFSKEVTKAGRSDGFRGVVDKDLDVFVETDHSSECLLYTDFGCMEAYLWTADVLGRLIIQFKAEGVIKKGDVAGLYESINRVCLEIAAVRIASALNPGWKLQPHNSDKSLEIHGKEVCVNMDRYVEQCKPSKQHLGAVRSAIADIKSKLPKYDILQLLNGHDLLWIATYILKNFTKAPKRTIEEETVAGALVAWGILNPALTNGGVFDSLAKWVAGGTE